MFLILISKHFPLLSYRALFLGDNDFSQCLKDYFPKLKVISETH